MILGVDTGMGTCGWARFDHARRCFDGLGAIATEQQRHKQKTDDQGDRIAQVAEALVVAMTGCDVVVVERMSFPPGGQVPIALGFAVVVGIARTMPQRPRVYTAKPQTWQRAVLPDSGKRVDYDRLEQVIGEYVRRDAGSAIALDRLDPKMRNHALDACAISLMGAFRSHECRPLGGR